MNLSRASAHFRTNPVYDAYTGFEITKAQLGVYSDAIRDGVTVQRRLLDCDPAFVRPPGGVVIVTGATYLLGAEAIDVFAGTATRKKYVMHLSDGLAQVSSLFDLLSGLDPLSAHAGRLWMKSTAEVEESSDKVNQVEVFFSVTEPVYAEQVIVLAGTSYFVRHTFTSAAGFTAAVCDELADPVLETGMLVGGTWNRITQTNDELLTPLTAVRIRWQADFDYVSQATEKFKAGDDVAVVLSSTIKAGFKVRFADGDWSVVASRAAGAVSYLHLRKP